MIENLPGDWNTILQSELSQPSIKMLFDSVYRAYTVESIYPPATDIFKAFEFCTFEKTKVVLLGQDPYHGERQAHGLSFSVNNGVKQPPSLRNIFKELQSDLPDFKIPLSGNLEGWSRQGVLLLNTILTVQKSLPGSHKNFGWEKFTDAVIMAISAKKEHVVFLLWGNYAISKSKLIDENKHLVLKAAHPSPLARGAFFGNKHFSRTNTYLESNGLDPIDWKLS